MSARAAAAEARATLAAAGIEDASFEAELLTREAANLGRASYFAGAELPGEARPLLEEWVQRRAGTREPLAYITGHREFYGREFALGPGVLVPRPETELLVELALAELSLDGSALVVDVGTGSGAIAVSVAAERPGAGVVGIDASGFALSVAARNAELHAPAVELLCGHLLTAVGRADVVLANLPYIPTGELGGLQPEVSRWEPRLALDGGPDGLSVIRELVDDCAMRLRPRLLALEVGFGQAATLCDELRQRALRPTVVKDLAGIDRVVCLRWP